MLIVTGPFERIGVDIRDPLTPSTQCHKYILEVVDYAIRNPEAMPLRNMRANTVARALAGRCTPVSFNKQVITDQGAAFMSETLWALWKLAGVQPLHTSVYHPQTNGLVERFNGTLKCMLLCSASSCKRMSPIGMSASHSCCLPSGKYPKPLQASPHSIFCSGDNPEGCWMWYGRSEKMPPGKELCPCLPT